MILLSLREVVGRAKGGLGGGELKGRQGVRLGPVGNEVVPVRGKWGVDK